MAETLALAVGVPAALGAVWLASRRSWMPAFRDVRGIALQTVIVIVVMLVIAGGVAGVLLSRADQVQSDLAEVNTSINPASSFEFCEAAGNALGVTATATASATAPAAGTAAITFDPAGGNCWVAAAGGVFSTSDCTNRGGTANTAGTLCTFTA